MENITTQQIGHGLRVSRTRARRRADATAEAIGVTVDTIRRWERGDTPVPVVMLFKLAELYGTTPDAIGKDGCAAGAGCS